MNYFMAFVAALGIITVGMLIWITVNSSILAAILSKSSPEVITTSNQSTPMTGTVAPNSVDLPSWNRILEWDFPGHDIGQPKPNVLAGECQKFCDSTPNCVAVAYASDLNACWLKDSLTVTQPILPGNRSVYMKPPKKHKLKTVPSVQIQGDHLFTVSAPNATSCGLLCHYNDNCKAATYHADGSNKCVLNKMGITTKPNVTATGYVLDV